MSPVAPGGLLARLGRNRPGRSEPRLAPLKLRAIDAAFERLGCETVADLGGVWAIDGGYALYAARQHGGRRVVICDDDFTDSLRERAADDPAIELVEGNFGEPAVAERVGAVDAVLLFDVLLHQVAPDWDELLALYAPRARCIVAAGPWWRGEATVRLLELGRERYLASVPEPAFHAEAWERLEQWNPRRGRPWRDCHDIWQWGITDADLRARMADLGFTLAYHENLGRWHGLGDFDDCSYVFERRGASEVGAP